MNNIADPNAPSGSQLGGVEKYGMLLMGIFLLMLSGGRFVTPSAAFLAPVFLLCFTRNTAFKTGMPILYVLLFLSMAVRLHNYVDVSRPMGLLLFAGFAVIEILPFIADRKLYKRLPVFLSTLVLPVVFVVLGFFTSKLFPFGTIGEKAYSQFGNLELMQLLSVTGTAGITFVIFWFAATMASLWDTGFVWRRCRSQIVTLSLCLMIIFVAGGFRNIFNENESPTVRIAGVVADQSALQKSLQAAGVDSVASLSVGGYEVDKVNTVLSAHHDQLLTNTTTQALAGASIVAWSEASGVLLSSRETEFVEKTKQLAREQKIYLVAALVVIADDNEDETRLNENKLMVFGPDGELLGEYRKSRLLWDRSLAEGDDVPLLLDTPYGKIAFAIGFDLDFPAAIRSAQGIDIIIAPASDWRTLAPHHSMMATYRGVENGASLFRPTNNGMSIASDSHGRVIAFTDHQTTTPHTLTADVPTRGKKTFYSTAGDWFAWLNVALLFVLAVIAFTGNRYRKDQFDSREDNFSPDERRDRSRITAIQWRDSERDNNLHRNE